MRDGTITKERIRSAALRLFVEQGIAETTIRDIAKAARVSQGAMYNHYRSKEDLAWELFSESFSAIGWELRRIQHEHASLEDKLAAMIRYVFELFDRNWLLVSFVFFARHEQLRKAAHREQLRKATGELGNPYVVFRSVVAEAMLRGEIPKRDPDLAAAMVTGAVIQVVDNKIFGRIKQSLSELSVAVAAGCLRLLQG